MNKNQLIAELTDYLAQAKNISRDAIKPDTSLRSFGLDSFDLVDVVTAIEERYSLEIPNEKIYELTTVNHIANFILEETNPC